METVMCIKKTTDEAIAYEGLVKCSISGRQGTYAERAGLVLNSPCRDRHS
jgi:hypothetical protein